MVRGGAGVGGDLADLLGAAGIAAGVLVGDPGEQFGLAGEELGPLGLIVAAGASTGFGEVMEELGYLAGGDCVIVGAVVPDLAVGSWRGPVPIRGCPGLGAFALAGA